METMTLRIYKNEYQPRQIAFLVNTFDVESESETILTISGTQEDLEKVMSGMFCSEAEFKCIFPKFITEEERIAYTKMKYEQTKRFIQDQLLSIINYGVIGKEFDTLRAIYNNL